MKKYLKEIEISGIILLFIGTVLGHLANKDMGACVIATGLLLWVAVIIYKAFKWKEYKRDNVINIVIILGAILAIFISFIIFAK